jgi:hypothetical protein
MHGLQTIWYNLFVCSGTSGAEQWIREINTFMNNKSRFYCILIPFIQTVSELKDDRCRRLYKIGFVQGPWELNGESGKPIHP